MTKKQLFKEVFFASLLVLAADLIISFFPLKFELLRPIKQGFNDFDIYDLRYAGNSETNRKKDTDITVICLGDTRQEIADQISTVHSFQPAAIGLDAIFKQKNGDNADDSLIEAVRHAGEITVASELGEYIAGDVKRDTVFKSFFSDSIPGLIDGLWNFNEADEEINRRFVPFIKVNGSNYPVFSTRVVQTVSPRMAAILSGRGNRLETINYTGDAGYFNVLSFEKYRLYKKEGSLAGLCRNKIVLIGFINTDPPYLEEDLHFTPMNKKYTGKSFPDMYGIIIHANIIEMMLKQKYITEMPRLLVYLLTFFITMGVMLFYISTQQRKMKHHHFFYFIFQFVLAVLLIYLALQFFEWFNFKLDMMPVIIAVVLSFEIFWLYEWMALKMHKLTGYETFLAE